MYQKRDDGMRIAIVEDEQDMAIELQHMLEQMKETDCTCYTSGEQFLFEYENHPVDLVFMDIQMKEMNGLETAKLLRLKDANVNLVFLTNDSGYVFDGYEVDALRYWLKPVKEEKLKELLESLSKPQPYLLWKLQGELIKLYEQDIYYLESDGHYCICHHKTGDYRKKANFSEECKHVSHEFLLCHRSYCVNVNHIHALRKDGCIMDNQDIVPVSRTMKHRLQAAFLSHCREDILCKLD